MNAPPRTLGQRARAIIPALTTFAIVFGSAYPTILITRGAGACCPVWPVNALVLVLLLRTRKAVWNRADLILSAALGSYLSNWLGGRPPALALWFTLSNGIGIGLTFLLIRRPGIFLRRPRAELAPPHLRAFLPACLLGPAVSASVAAGGMALVAGAPYFWSWLDWYLPDVLGMLIIVPLGVLITPNDLRPLKTGRGLRNAGICIALVLVAALAGFCQRRWPVLFLITPAILLAAYQRRVLGAAASIVLVAMIAVPMTAARTGSLMLVPNVSMAQRQYYLQFFLVTQTLIALSVAASLNERDGLKRKIEAREQAAVEEAGAKSRLLMGVSHEIRTPLSVIKGLGELLSASEPLTERQRALIDHLLGAGSKLQTLATDLLDRSRIERGALVLTPQWVDLHHLLAAIIAEANGDLPSNAEEIRFEASRELTCWADPQRTRQIVQNLLSNAIKYAAAYGPVRVHAAQVGAMVRIEIIDHGRGIAPSAQSEVFEPFNRIGPDTAGAKSAGVGLSLAKLLAEAQGGAVGMRSTPFVETRFWVDLPIEPPAGAAQAKADAFTQIDPDLVFGAPTIRTSGDDA